jgi:hypothetical protein
MELLGIAQNIANDYGGLPQVKAVVLAGSVIGGSADDGSDVDLYVYADTAIPVSARAAIANARSQRSAVDNRFWEEGDEWIESDSGVAVDVTFRSPPWIEDQLDRVLVRHEASTGYSTCFWYNVLHSQILFDREGWFQRLHQRARQPYPEGLRQAIIAKNHPILRDLLVSSYLHQLKKALQRGDLVSINHRVAALVASYFDVLFAINRLPHPGEKRLVTFAEEHCGKLPVQMREQVNEVLVAAGRGDQQVVIGVQELIHNLDQLLLAEGLISAEAGNRKMASSFI